MTRVGTANTPARPLPNPDRRWDLWSACRGRDTEIWFASDTSEAKSTCRRCAVRADCLAWALANGLDHGVWGGMDEKERRALKKRKANGTTEVKA